MIRVHVNAADIKARAGVLALLGQVGIIPTTRPEPSPETVIVAAGATVDEAIDACPDTFRSDGYPMIAVADTFTPAGVRRAVGAGVWVLMRSAEATPVRLMAALRSALHGDSRIPYEALVRLLNDTVPAADSRRTEFLTARQTTVLKLMADGYCNAAIATKLVCSEHTVKNVIYDLMAQLQVRNRAHAVALGVRAGVI